MDPYRTNKLNQSVLKVLSDLLTVAVKDPRVGFVTINSVKLNRDHSVAEVFWSIMSDDQDERKTSFAGLKKARGFMQSKLTRTLGLRQSPNLRFIYDDSIERSLELDEVLDGLADQGEFLSEADRRRQMTLEDLQPPLELMRGLRQARSIWIQPHFNPDPDAIGSALALAEALEAMGRRVRVIGFEDPPVGLSEMPGYHRVTLSGDVEAAYAEDEPDLLMLVDCHRIDRAGPLEDFLGRFTNRLCVDHHLVSGRKAPEAGWVEARSCSTCTLVYRVIAELEEGDKEAGAYPVEFTVDMATNIYSGLINDTGSFRFSNTMPLTFELARRLSETGVDTALVSRTTMHRYRREGLSLLEKVLASFDYHANGQVLIARATQAMLAETGGTLADTEGFVNIATAVDGVRLIAFMKELGPGVWRVSLRVRGDGDVQTIAARYGGGGHKQASGCTIKGEADEVAELLIGDLTAALHP